MKTILVTGGAGYIGSHTVKELKKLSYKSVVLDNLVYGHKESIKDSIEVFGTDYPNPDDTYIRGYNHIK